MVVLVVKPHSNCVWSHTRTVLGVLLVVLRIDSGRVGKKRSDYDDFKSIRGVQRIPGWFTKALACPSRLLALVYAV